MRNICTGLAIGLVVGMLAVTYSEDVKRLTEKSVCCIAEKINKLKKA